MAAKPVVQYLCASHMRDFLEPLRLQTYINYAVEALRGWDFDSIAFRGMSGALIGPPVALRMNKDMIMVRKESDDTHSPFPVEGRSNINKYVILDDFASSGNTVRQIRKAIKTFQPKAKCLGYLSVQYIDLQTLAECKDKKYPLKPVRGRC